jgi:hypothetical protein
MNEVCTCKVFWAMVQFCTQGAGKPELVRLALVDGLDGGWVDVDVMAGMAPLAVMGTQATRMNIEK